MPFLPFGSRSKGKHILFVDAGTSAIKFLLLQKRDKQPEILEIGMESVEKFLWEKSLQKVIVSLQGRHSRIDGIVLNLSPLVFRAGVFHCALARKKPSKAIIQKREEQELSNEMIQLMRHDILQHFSTLFGIPPEELIVTKLKVVNAKIDGYDVPRLQGFAGSTINVTVLGTCIPMEYKRLLDRLQRAGSVKEAKLMHWTEGLEMYGAQKSKDGIYFDVGDQMTQIAVIKNGVIQFAQEIKRGGDNFTYAVEREVGLQESMARDYKERYGKGEFTEEMRSKIHSTLLIEAQKWITLCKEKLILHEGVLPSFVYLIGGGGELPELQEVLREDELKELPLNGVFKLNFLYPSNIMSFSPNPQSKNIRFTPLFFLCYAN